MKGKYFNKLILGLIILIPIFCLGIFNSNVSLQYETNNPSDCISQISGKNLCQDIEQGKILIIIDVIILILLMVFRKKIIKA